MPPTNVRDLDDDSVGFLLQAYVDLHTPNHRGGLHPDDLYDVCAALYGPGRCGDEYEDEDGDADAESRLWKYACQTLGLTTLPPSRTTWRGTYANLRSFLYFDGTLFRWQCKEGQLAAVDAKIAEVIDPFEAAMAAVRDVYAAFTGDGTVNLFGVDHVAMADTIPAAMAAAHGVNVAALVEALRAPSAALGAAQLRVQEVLLGRDRSKMTALMWASWNGHVDVVRALLSAFQRFYPETEVHRLYDLTNAVTAKDMEGDTALMQACARGHLEVVEAILAVQPTAEKMNRRLESALTVAARTGRTDILKALLGTESVFGRSWRQVLEKESNRNRTPLMIAVEAGNTEAVRVLLEAGANVNHASRLFGGVHALQTALDLAGSSRVPHPEIVELLVAYGATTNTEDRAEIVRRAAEALGRPLLPL